MLAFVAFFFNLLAAPGVIVHEFAHKKACDLMGVPVLEVAYFRLGTPAGYVRHREPDRYRQSFVISVAPFLVNTVLAFVAFLGVAMILLSNTGTDPGLETVLALATAETAAFVALLCWFGFSIGIQAFPSTGDAKTLWNRSRSEWRRSPIVLLGVPVVVVIYVVNLLSWFFLDVLYAFGLLVGAFYVVTVFGV